MVQPILQKPTRIAPVGYIPGFGRGAAGFTTRCDIGPAAAATTPHGISPDGNDAPTTSTVNGSRAAAAAAAGGRMFGNKSLGSAPKGYIAGSGRGAGVKKPMGGAGGGGGDGDEEGGGLSSSGGGTYDQFGGYDDRLFESTPYDQEDEEADKIYDAIDERLNARHNNAKRKREKMIQGGGGIGGGGNGGIVGDGSGGVGRIGDQFRELKEKLKTVTEEEWDAIPDVGDYSLKHKQKRREDTFTPLPDTLLKSQANLNAANVKPSSMKTISGTATSISTLSEARNTVLTMSLDKMSDTVSASTVDPKGYLTSLSTQKISTEAEISDVNKARLLLKSVRDTNPKHGPGWIAAARVEECANKITAARKVISEGCEACPDSEDVWLEAARLYPPEKSKSILATAVRQLPHSVKIFLRAAELEQNPSAKKAVLRRALESIPTSVTLWKAAIELENEEDAKILLGVAVEKVPGSMEMWLALARLETYENARKVLNQARRALPAERAVWIAAAKLEEGQEHDDMVDKIVEKAVKSLKRYDAVVSREQWLKEAETAEVASHCPLVSAAIVKHTVEMGVEVEDRMRTWSADASSALARGAVATARAILAHSLTVFPTKRALWMQAVELERKHGNGESLDEVLAAASERLPRAEIFWLVRAKERWLKGDIDMAREILTKAFAANPDSESVWLAAAKLEWETGEVERARVLLQRARDRASSPRVYMKSALLERENHEYTTALDLINEGISQYPTFPKLYMMGGQISSEDVTPPNLDQARQFYQNGLKANPSSVTIWTLAATLEEKHTKSYTKARSLLELARLKNPRNPQLWVASIRLERRAGNDPLATTLTARALQECPNSGLLLAEYIRMANRIETKRRCADAIRKCPDDPLVISAVARLFVLERKEEKARKWLERAVVLDPDLGDSWGRYLAFEREYGTVEQRERVKERCVKSEPKHGEIWCGVAKDMVNRRKSVGEILELVVEAIKKEGVALVN